jgi:hypothetical protein
MNYRFQIFLIMLFLSMINIARLTAGTSTTYSLPYLQSFTSTSLPADWTSDMSATANHGTSGSIGLTNRLNSDTTTCYALSPLVGIITSSTYLSFHYRVVNFAGYPLVGTTLSTEDMVEIQVSVDNGASFMTIHTIGQGNHTATSEFMNKVINLGAYDGDFVKIRFLCTRASGDFYVDIDNVLFEDGTSMSFSTATTEQVNTSLIGIGTNNNDILRLQVITQKGSNPLYLTSMTVSANGATGDLSSARIFYTTSPVFSTAIQFGNVINNPDGAFSFIGSQVLAQGNNYFWMAFNVKSTATPGNSVDGTCSVFITSESGTGKIPNVTSPAGNRYIGATFSGTKSIPGDYATLGAAITALNGGIVNAGGVTFNIAAGHTETASAAIILTATGTSANPIIFRKSGEGNNPLVTAQVGISGTSDAVIKIAGGDYITFDGIDILDPVSNTSNGSRMEWGYALVKAQNISPFNGCQYVTIKNCNITLQKAYTNTVGIYAGNHIAWFTTPLAILLPSDAMNNCKFNNNIISNVYTGIKLSGFDDAAPYTLYDQGNEIGVSGTNTISNFGGGSVVSYGISTQYESGIKVANNSISGNSTPSGTVNGIYSGQGVNVSIYKNDIHDLSSSSTTSTAGIINGILIGGGTSVYVYNNFISDLKTPSASNPDAIRGISVISTQENSAIGVYYNTVYLDAASSGANFGTSGIYHTSGASATTAALDLRNNIIINKSIPAGTSYTAAFRRSEANLENYKSTSNNNIFYSGTPGTTKVIYYAGTAKQTIEDFRSLVGPGRDSISFSENPVFSNVTTAPYNLRMQDGYTNYCESGGQPINSPIAITADFDGAIRPATPDIGADEFSGTAAYVAVPASFSATCAGISQINTGWTKNANNNEVMLTSMVSAPISGNPLNGTAYNVGDAVPSAGTVIYKGPASSFIHSDLDTWSQHFYKIWSVNANNYYSFGLQSSSITDADTIEALPYLQDFGLAWMHNPAAPDQWKVFNADGSNSPAWRKEISYFHLGPACAEGSGNNNDYLVSPPISLPDTNCRVYWWDKVENASDNNTYRVMVSTTGSEPSAFTVSLDTFNCTNTMWTRHELNLSQYKGQTVFLAFHQFFSANPNSDFAIDDIQMDTLPLGILFSQWQGSVSNDWGNPANWSEGVPGATHEVTIIAGDFNPVISTAVSIYRMNIMTGATVIVTPTGTLTVTGD